MKRRKEEEKKSTRYKRTHVCALGASQWHQCFFPRLLNLSTSRYVLHKLYSCYQWNVVTGEFVIREAYKFGNVVLVHLAEKTSDTQGVNGVPDIIDDVKNDDV